MIGEKLEKPPTLLLASQKLNCTKHSSFNDKEERAVHKFIARYDAFQGILKRVSEMKLNGSLDSEEPNTEPEKSKTSRSVQPRRRGWSGDFLVNNRSNLIDFENESSASSITGSDHGPSYEEISRVGSSNRYSCTSLPSYPSYAETNFPSFREDFPPPPSPSQLYENVLNQISHEEYKTREITKMRPKSVIDMGDRIESPFRLISDNNESPTKIHGKAVSLEQSGQPEGISEAEKHQLEMFFRSLKTNVFICSSLVNLYFGWKDDERNWNFRHTGVVVVVFDSGNTRCRKKRKIQILLAERGTCFPLWKDTIDNLSAYHKSGNAFHTMCLSNDHRQMVGFSFDSPTEADKLLSHLEELTSDPENINISVPGSRKKKTYPKKKAASLPHKKQISNPCLFQHVTSVAAKDKPIYMSLQTLIHSENMKKEENMC